MTFQKSHIYFCGGRVTCIV